MIEMLQKEMPELKTGMYVKFRKGSDYSERFGMVVENRIIILYPEVESLFKECYESYISEVYEAPKTEGERVIDTEIIKELENKGNTSWIMICIWKDTSEKEVKEMTMNDLEEHFKCKVKIVK